MVGSSKALPWFGLFVIGLIFLQTGSEPTFTRKKYAFIVPTFQTFPIKKQAVVAAYGNIPLTFEANEGQTDPEVKFLARGDGYTLFLTTSEAVLTLRGSKPLDPIDADSTSVGVEGRKLSEPAVIHLQFVEANPDPQLIGLDELPGKSNYFIGKDSEKWRTDVPNYAKVRYRDVYPGVDLVYYGNQGQLEYDFVLSPGADPNAIKLDFQGADELEVDGNGDLLLGVAGGQVWSHKPLVYQEANGVRQEISGGYVLQGKHQVGFQVAAYDKNKTLVIDPVLVYSSYFGGSRDEVGQRLLGSQLVNARPDYGSSHFCSRAQDWDEHDIPRL